jgi:translation initiation factor IF-2
MEKNSVQKNIVERPPVVVVMGHIDHGKSTLLDYIRKTNIVDKEAGGITQHVSAYEAIYEDSSSKKRRVTFLDTPGHESFQTLRSRGAQIADVAILVVSAEDGVKPQTIEAIKKIREQNVPFIVAINKIDKPNADINRTKVSLAENDVYVEGFGGTVSCIPISAKTGEGISDLLDVVFLTTDVQELVGDTSAPASGLVIESKLDSRKGITATLIIKNGTLQTGQFIVVGESMAVVRMIENDLGEKIDSATFSTPVIINGWSSMVQAGAEFKTYLKKTDAVAASEAAQIEKTAQKNKASTIARAEYVVSEATLVPFIIKADTLGSLEAIRYEISKLKSDRVETKIISEGVGPVSEGDVKTANTNTNQKAVILAFNVKTDNPAKILAERDGIAIETFSIIYKLTERIDTILKERTPKMMIDEVTGSARVLRTFSRQRDKQIIGGRVDEGFLATQKIVKIIRRDVEIGVGRIKNLQQQKQEVDEVKSGTEFGALVESKFEIAVGDVLRAFHTIEK